MRFFRLTVWLLLLFCMVSCASDTEAEGYCIFTDDCGTVVALEKKPEKTAVLFSSFAEIWSLAGGEISVTVGETLERGFAPDTAVLADEGAGKTMNIEILLESRPDFVIGSADIPAQVDAAAILRDAGIPCGLFRVESFGDYLRVLEICCDITGNKEAFETYGTAVKEEIDGILSSAERKEEKILFLRAGSSERSTKAKTAGEHFAAAMLEELGAYNIADNAPVLLDGLSMEEIITENPGAVFITTMGDETAAVTYMRSRLETSEWQVLDAVKQGRVYFLPKDLFQFKPNHRWAEAYRMLTELLYEE